MEPQMNADECRYSLSTELERTDTNSGQSKLAFLPPRMTQIGRIFTDFYYPYVSTQSVLYPIIFRLNQNSGLNMYFNINTAMK